MYREIIIVAQTLGVRVYVVGGVVRDALLGIEERKDIDMVVVGSGLAFANAFAERVGEDRGTLVEFSEFDTARFV